MPMNADKMSKLVHDLMYLETLWKSEESADENRRKGNNYFKKYCTEVEQARGMSFMLKPCCSNACNALLAYNESLCLSPPGSPNIPLIYANRSAVFLKLKCYKECLENIQLAIDNNYPVDTLYKLEKRREACLKNQQDDPEADNKFKKNIEAHEKFFKPTIPGNKKFDFYVADCLQLKKNQEFGHYVVTNTDLKVGTVLAIEDPISKFVTIDRTYERCLNCLKRNKMNLLPCHKCTKAMFCSEKCREEGMERFHKHECGVARSIATLFQNQSQIACLKVRYFLDLLNFCGSVGEVREMLKGEYTIFDYKKCSKRNKLRSIHKNFKTIKEDQVDQISITIELLMKNSAELDKLCRKPADREFFESFFRSNMTFSAVTDMPLCRLCDEVNTEKVEILYGDGANEMYGWGNYAFYSLVNHSCIPNIWRINVDGGKQTLITVKPIKKGEQIFICCGRTYMVEDRAERQAHLTETMGFQCKCPACTQNWPKKNKQRSKDPSFNEKFPENDQMALKMDKLDCAVATYPKICKYLDDYSDMFTPSKEISAAYGILADCVRAFIRKDDF